LKKLVQVEEEVVVAAIWNICVEMERAQADRYMKE
jgi:hypothetical protein